MPGLFDNSVRTHVLAVIALAGCGLGLYFHTLDYPYVFDDNRHIPDNRNIRMESLDRESMHRAAYGPPTGNRPVAMLSFGLNYFLSGSSNPAPFRLTNIIIHISNGILVYAFVFMLVTAGSAPAIVTSKPPWKPDHRSGLASSGSAAAWLALAVALLWLVHPLQIQSVVYVVQRMNSLAVFFTLASLCAYMIGRRAESRVLSCVVFVIAAAFWLLGIKSKQIAAVAPILILVIESYFFQNFNKKWLLRGFKYYILPSLCVGAVALIVIGPRLITFVKSTYGPYSFTATERVMTQFRVLMFYISLFIYPHPERLNLDHEFEVSKSLLQPSTTALCLMILLALIGLSVGLAKKHRLFSFCIVWYFITLAIESSVIGLEMVYEHRLYLPSIGMMLAAAYAVFRYVPARPYLRPALTMIVAGLLAAGTYTRTRIWSDEFTLWQDCARKSPNAARPLTNYGRFLEERGRVNEAIDLYRRALRVSPNYSLTHNNLSVALIKLDRLDEANFHCRRAIAEHPDYVEAHINLGTVLQKQGNLGEAIDHYQAAVRLDPFAVEAHINLCDALVSAGRAVEARTHCEAAVRERPKQPDVHNGLGQYCVRISNFEEAVRHLKNALKLSPSFPAAHHNMGIALSKQGRLEEAIRHYREAVGIQPDFVEAHNNLGIALRKNGQLDEAIEQYRAALSYNPDYLDSHNNLGVALVKQNRLEAALHHFQEALRIRPGFKKAADNVAFVRRKLDDASPASTDKRDAEARAYNVAGSAHFAKGEIEEAIDSFRQALAVDPDFADAHNNLGAALGRLGRLDDAIKQFAEAVRIDPNYNDAKQNFEAARQYKEQRDNEE